MKVLRDFAVPSVPASYPVRPGNALRPLVDGEPAFRRVCEAIDGARHSVWVTVTFMWAGFQMPDGRGSALDVLSHAAARGLDVRVIFWRPAPEAQSFKKTAFWGSPEHVDLLRASGPDIRVRWDCAQPGFCQHQKSWLVDAGTDAEIAFLGGINLNPNSVVAPGHRGEGQNHDVYLQVAGPSVVDIHHNFVQRWNEASERLSPDGLAEPGSDGALPFPVRVPASRGNAVVQIQRTMPDGRYHDGRATPGGTSFNISGGERSNFEQYCAAILAARRSIYIEQQHIEVPEIVACLRQALLRGVEIVAVVPAAGKHAELAALGGFENFTLAGIAGLGEDGQRKPVWVHSKLMVVDGEWGTVGSCNLHRHSLFGNSEMNAAFWDRQTAHVLLNELFSEHLGQDVAGLDDLAALRLFRGVAARNRALRQAGDMVWQGLAFSLLP